MLILSCCGQASHPVVRPRVGTPLVPTLHGLTHAHAPFPSPSTLCFSRDTAVLADRQTWASVTARLLVDANFVELRSLQSRVLAQLLADLWSQLRVLLGEETNSSNGGAAAATPAKTPKKRRSDKGAVEASHPRALAKDYVDVLERLVCSEKVGAVCQAGRASGPWRLCRWQS